jgi:hypothetical protein
LSGFDQSLLQYSAVEAAASGPEEASDEALIAKLEAELEAGQSRLADLQHGVANGKHIANVKRLLEESGKSEVFPKEAEVERPAEFPEPGGVMLRRVAVDGLVGTAVNLQIRLLVASRLRRRTIMGPVTDCLWMALSTHSLWNLSSAGRPTWIARIVALDTLASAVRR